MLRRLSIAGCWKRLAHQDQNSTMSHITTRGHAMCQTMSRTGISAHRDLAILTEQHQHIAVDAHRGHGAAVSGDRSAYKAANHNMNVEYLLNRLNRTQQSCVDRLDVAQRKLLAFSSCTSYVQQMLTTTIHANHRCQHATASLHKRVDGM